MRQATSLLLVLHLAGCVGALEGPTGSRRISAVEGEICATAGNAGVPVELLAAVFLTEKKHAAEPLDTASAGAALRTSATHLHALAVRHFGGLPGSWPREPGEWYPVLLQYAEVDDAVLADRYASAVSAVLSAGASREFEDGWVELAPTPVDYLSRRLFRAEAEAPRGGDVSVTAGVEPGNCDFIVVGGLSGGAAPVTGHQGENRTVHLVGAGDGQLTWRTGPEGLRTADCLAGRALVVLHEALQAPERYTDEVYASSARLVRFLAERHDVPLDREHLLGPSEIAEKCGLAHAEGGWLEGWNWSRYMGFVDGSIRPAPLAVGKYYGTVFEVNPLDATDMTKVIAGATVSLSTGVTQVTGAAGTFRFDDVEVGTRTATASKAGYNTASSERTVVAETIAWGSIGLTPSASPGTGSYKGVVFEINPVDLNDRTNVISGALVKLSTGQSLTTGANGAFSFDLAPGSYTATATKTGYQAASSTQTVTSGGTAWGSIGLTADALPDQQPPNITIDSPASGVSLDSALLRIKGSVTDDTAVAKLSSVLNGGAPVSRSFGTEGGFDFEVTLVPGENRVDITAVDGSGNSASVAVTSFFRTGLSGYVFKEGDEAARISGAAVVLSKLEGLQVATAMSGPDGSFALDAAPGEYRISVSFVGFVARTQAATVNAQARSQLRVELAPSTALHAEIGFTSPRDGDVVSSSPVLVTGMTRNFEVDGIEVNGVSAVLGMQGKFSALIALHEGLNGVTAVARGKGGEQVSASMELRYSPEGMTGADAGAAGTDAGLPGADASTGSGEPSPELEGGCGCSAGAQSPSLLAAVLAFGMFRRRRG